MAEGKRQLAPWEMAARRRNAQKSTGPRTGAGKRRSALKGRHWGLCLAWQERAMLTLGEDPRQFQRLHRDLIAFLKPSDVPFEWRVADLSQQWWRKVRALRMGRETSEERWALLGIECRIDHRLILLIMALKRRRRKWYYGLKSTFGGFISSPADLRRRIESRLEIFKSLNPDWRSSGFPGKSVSC